MNLTVFMSLLLLGGEVAININIFSFSINLQIEF